MDCSAKNDMLVAWIKVGVGPGVKTEVQRSVKKAVILVVVICYPIVTMLALCSNSVLLGWGSFERLLPGRGICVGWRTEVVACDVVIASYDD